MTDRDNSLASGEAHAIARLSTLERLREQARAGNREAMVRSIESMIEAELRALRKMRETDDDAGSPPRTGAKP